MWNKIKKWLKPWPKRIRFEVRDGNCHLIGMKTEKVKSWNEVMVIGSEFCQSIMRLCPDEENLDEVYWRYEEI